MILATSSLALGERWGSWCHLNPILARGYGVMNGSAGHHIGLQPDDVILEIDGNEVLNSSYISGMCEIIPVRKWKCWRTVDGEIRSATAVLEEASIN